MIVDIGDQIRDGSGDFGCPNCWRRDFGKVIPSYRQCPTCGVALEWTDRAKDVSLRARANPLRRSKLTDPPTEA